MIRNRSSWQRIFTLIGVALSPLLFSGCETSALGRRQLKLMPESQMTQMGASAFTEISNKTPASSDSNANANVRCVANAITSQVRTPGAPRSWEVRVFADDSANAFALPGGKIGVNTGLLTVAKTPDQLATVIGHEVAHVLAGHSNERVSASMTAQAGMSAVEAVSNPANPAHSKMLGLLGTGTQVGILLPYGRSHEREADLMGLDLMASAGFDPRQSVELWRNMAAAGGEQPSEFLSTHPSHQTRIADLQQRMSSAMKIFERARSEGRRPAC